MDDEVYNAIDSVRDSVRDTDNVIQSLSKRIDWLVAVEAARLRNTNATVKVPPLYYQGTNWGNISGVGDVVGGNGTELLVKIGVEVATVEATDVEVI